MDTRIFASVDFKTIVALQLARTICLNQTPLAVSQTSGSNGSVKNYVDVNSLMGTMYDPDIRLLCTQASIR